MRALLGVAVAALSVAITFSVPPLRAFPFMTTFPAVIISAWFFGMAGCYASAVADLMLAESFLLHSPFRFSTDSMHQSARFALFFLLSTALGAMIRRLADQRSQLHSQELKESLLLAETRRQIAEERAQASEALRERDELLQIALSTNGLGTWVWDLGSDRMQRSTQALRLAGLEPNSVDERPEAWFSVVHPEDVEQVREAVERARNGPADYHCVYRVCLRDGSLRWLESQGKCQKDANGRVTRIVGVVADVTPRKHAEEAMLRAEKLAVAGRLAASVAHEINNPLEAVANLLYLVTLASTAEDAHAHARVALDELLRVSLITQSTLKFHRQTGTPRIAMLSEIMEGVLALFRPRMNAAGVKLETQSDGEIAISCMPSEAQQIFANLISNAVEATPAGGRIRIRIHGARDARSGKPGMRVSIADSGSGMDRTTLDRIFEPFFTTKAETGTGLGLWVVAQLVARQGGTLRVRSTPRDGASGTVFSLFLPAEPAAADGAEIENTTAMLGASS